MCKSARGFSKLYRVRDFPYPYSMLQKPKSFGPLDKRESNLVLF